MISQRSSPLQVSVGLNFESHEEGKLAHFVFAPQVPSIVSKPSKPVNRPLRLPFSGPPVYGRHTIYAKRSRTRRISFSLQMFDEPLRPAAIDIHLANGIRGEMSTHRVRKESHGNTVIFERVE